MGRIEGNCPSETFLATPPIESFDEVKLQIEQLFNIKIESNFRMSAGSFFIEDYKIKQLERHLGKKAINVNKPSYNVENGLIIIPSSLYNERSFIHEVLHAFSNLTSEKLVDTKEKKKDYWRKINKVIREGISEFLTGCILFKFYPDCYEFFRDYNSYVDLGFQYYEETIFWFVFAQIFGIEMILKIYFDRSLRFKSYEDFHKLIIEEIQKKYPNFYLENAYNLKEWQFKLSLASIEFEDISLKINHKLDYLNLKFL